jgi:hypothetical protein
LERDGADVQVVAELSDRRAISVQPELADCEGSDGSHPLADGRLEEFVGAYVESRNAAKAYLTHVSARCSAESAAQQASRVLRRPAVAARVTWLMRDEVRRRIREGRDLDVLRAGEGAYTDAQMLHLTRVMTADPSVSRADQLRALQEHRRICEQMRAAQAARTHVDPAILMAYLGAAARQGRDVAAEADRAEDEGSVA